MGEIPTTMMFDVLGKFAYVTNTGDNTITALSFNKENGSVANIDAKPDQLPGKPKDIVIQ